MNELPQKACWRAVNVSAVISNEALEGHEGVFLATHTPISGFDILGSHSGEIAEPTERAVLTTLSDPARRHAFCVVQGEPGSGKSHLIRWLSVNWPHGNDIKLLLQRADGSLEGALNQLKSCLPAEFKELFDNLGQRHRATEQGRANIFRTNLANALDPEHFDPPLEDVDWCRTNKPTELVGHFQVRKWNGPGRILRLLEGKGRGEGDNERNSASANFDLFDIEELAGFCSGLHGTGVLPATEKLAQRLLQEFSLIREMRNEGWTAEELEREVSQRLKTSTQLMTALNRRRNDAIQNVLGVSAEGLKKLFRQIREALAPKGQRLVLLLEDITSWEGIDDSLIDVLVTNADTRGDDNQNDMCPLISVVGVTPAYYQKLHGNYRGRITLELSLGKAKEGELQDVATLRDRTARQGFAVRYLAAVRAGEQLLNKWREARRTDHDLLPPNPCSDCLFRDGCHHVFGQQDGIGFYPFSVDALEHMFSALNDHDNGMTWKTPRGVLQAILSPNLSRPQTIEDGEFPTALLENKSLVPESRWISPLLTQAIEAASPEDEHARLRRTLAYWGDKERADTTLTDTGDLAFAGVPRGVFDAFKLTWIGGQAADVVTPTVRPPTGISATYPTEPETPKPTTGKTTPPIVPPKPPAPGPIVLVPPSKRKLPTKSELETLRAQIRAWGETGKLESPTEWNKTLHLIVQQIDPRLATLDPFTFKTLLTPERVKIEGTGPSQRNYFNVKPDRWVLNGFEGFIAIRLDKAMHTDVAEFHRDNLALMMLHLKTLVSDYADRRLTLVDGRRWSAIPALVQVLLARAWLRGVVVPEDSLSAQLRAILSDEQEAESDPAVRSQPWQEFLNKTKHSHDTFRSALREMIATPQGEVRNFGLADVSSVAAPIIEFRKSLKFDSFPATGVDTGVSEFDKVREVMREFDGGLSRILRIERDQMKTRADILRKSLRGMSIGAHFARIDKAVESVAKHLPTAAPDRVRDWKAAYNRLKARFDAGSDAIVEDLLTTYADSDALPVGNAPLLGFLVRAPAGDLEEFRNLAQTGEQVMSALLAHVDDCVREGRGTASLDTIHDVGRDLSIATNSNGFHPGKGVT